MGKHIWILVDVLKGKYFCYFIFWKLNILFEINIYQIYKTIRCLFCLWSISKWISKTMDSYIACIRMYTYTYMWCFRTIFKIVFLRHVPSDLECHFLTRVLTPFFVFMFLYSLLQVISLIATYRHSTLGETFCSYS